MAWQLIYTSAPELLEAGRSGFGTVAKHEAIRPSLQTELDRISQFSREDGLEKDRVIFSHRVLDLRGERFHVLSRISDAGFDYTGRTNHIAHHIVIKASEAEQCYLTSRCTPADMILWFASKNLWKDRWNDPARLLTPEEEIPTGSVTPIIELLPEGAVTWALLTGSASNAAILAPGGSATEACWPIFPAHCDEDQRLRLIGESLCLHPDPWSVSFSTDTQPTDRIEELRWRGVSAGSPVERVARQSVRPVLDLGNQEELRKFDRPESATHLAETGLIKAPPALATARSGVGATKHGVAPKDRPASITTDPFARGGTGTSHPLAGSVSLKDRMKVKGDGQADKNKGIPASWIVISVIAVLLLLGAFVWTSFVIDVANQSATLSQNIRTILRKLNGNDSSEPNDDWVKKQFGGISIGNYIVDLTFSKSKEIESAVSNISRLQSNVLAIGKNSSTNNTIYEYRKIYENYKNDHTSGGIEGGLITYIDGEINKNPSETKSSAPTSTTPKPTTTPIPKVNQTITFKIDGKCITNGQSLTSTNGQKFLLEASSTSGASVDVTKGSGPGDVTGNSLIINGNGTITLKLGAAGNDQMNAVETNVQIIIIPPASRITGIKFMDSKEVSLGHFFGTLKPLEEIKGWTYWVTNGCATNLLQLVSSPLKDEDKTICPHNDSFMQEFSKPNSCFFKKDNITQEVTLTIEVNGTNPITNVLGFSPIVIQQTGDQYKCTLLGSVAPLIDLFKAGKNTVEYNIFLEPKIAGVSPESLTDNINKKIKSLAMDITLAEGNLRQEEDRRKQTTSTNSETFKNESASNQKYPDMENAGEILSQGMNFKSSQVGKPDGFPEDLKKYSAWRQSNKKDTNRETYTEYLKAVLAKIKECENGLTFQTDTYISATKKIEDINVNNKPETPTLGITEKNDKAFMANFKRLFTPDWGKNLEKFIASTVQPKATPTPDVNVLREDLSNKQNKLRNYKESIQISPQQILVREVNGKDSLILTTSP